MTNAADGAAARVMARQHALITLEQARVVGFSRGMIHDRVTSGWWIRFGGAVYGAAGSERTHLQRGLAACLIAGPGAVVSHKWASAIIWEYSGVRSGRVDILVPQGRSTRNAIARVHRTVDLPTSDVTVRHGVPVTRPARTLFDLSGVVSLTTLEEAVDDALCRRLTSLDEIQARLTALASPGRASNNLRRVLEAWDPGPLPANVREMRVFRSLVAHGFPRPSRQHVIRDSRGRFVARVDLAFVPERIGLEVHSRRWHATPRGLARDERREARIRAAGWDVRWCEPDDIPYSSIGNALRAARAA